MDSAALGVDRGAEEFKGFAELAHPAAAQLARPPCFDHRLCRPRGGNDPFAPRGQSDQACAPVGGIGHALDVPRGLKAVRQRGRGLLGDAGATGEHRQASAPGRLASMRRHVPGMSCREALVDVVAHEQDIALPLGRIVTPPARHVAESADRVLSYGGRGNARVFRRLPLGGVRLVATDHDWASGTGPEVTATMLDLFLLLVGRTARLEALDGPGAALVVARIEGRAGDR